MIRESDRGTTLKTILKILQKILQFLHLKEIQIIILQMQINN